MPKSQLHLAKKGGEKFKMKLIKILAVVAIAASTLSLGACASKKPAPQAPTTTYSK